jgi:ATP-binding protein involved in chromosome partitioning
VTEATPLLEDLSVVQERIRERLADVACTVAVMSGKGGVGKSAVAVNLALALARSEARVGILDADLNGPSVAKMLGLRGQPLRVGSTGLRAVPGPFGVAVQSMDFFLQGTQGLDWDGPAGEGSTMRSALEEAAIADLLGQTEWGRLDVLVVDLAPGADRLPALARLHPALSGALAVAIPTEVALLAVERSVRRAREAGVPLIGLVENMGSTVCAACGTEGPLFQEAPVDGFARAADLDVVARIPFDPRLAFCADAGKPFLEGEGLTSAAGAAFERLAARVRAFRPEERRDEW